MANFTDIAPRGRFHATWARLRLLDRILPPPDENRLVSVAEVGRGALALVEGSLADVGVIPIISETRSMSGESRFRVLVSARDARLVEAAIAGF